MIRSSTHRLLLLVLVTLAATAATAPRGATPSPAIVQQIDALLKQRLRPEPLPIDLPNPFVVPGGGIRDGTADPARLRAPLPNESAPAPAANPDREAVPATHADVLAACAAKLKVGGTIRTKDQVQIVINDAPRREGDFITVPWQGSSVHLRIVRLQADQLTLRYQDAELTLRF